MCNGHCKFQTTERIERNVKVVDYYLDPEGKTQGVLLGFVGDLGVIRLNKGFYATNADGINAYHTHIVVHKDWIYPT